MGLNFSRHEPGRYGAMSPDSKRRYVILKMPSGWTAESHVMVKDKGPVMNMSYGGHKTLKEAQYQCEDWDRQRRIRKSGN